MESNSRRAQPLLGSLVAAFALANVQAQTVREIPTPDQGIRIAAGETHRYRIFASAGGSTHIHVEQQSIDLVLTIEFDNAPALRVNAPGGPQGREDLVVDAAAGVPLLLVVEPKLRLIPAGHYRLTIAPTDASDAPGEVLRELSAAGAEEIAETAAGQRSAREHLHRALEFLSEPTSSKDLRALLWFRSAVMARRLNDLPNAIVDYRRALSLNIALGDKQSEARTRNGLGLSLRSSDRIAEARAEFEKALRLAERSGDEYEAASAGNNVCLTYLHFGNMASARPCLERAVRRYEAAGLAEHSSIALVNLAATYDFLGLPDLALARYAQAIELRRGGREKLPLAQILLNLAVLRRNVGDYNLALANIDEALSIIREVGDRAYEARALGTKGSIFRSAGLPDRAQVYFGQALPIGVELNDRRGQADSLSALADIDRNPETAEEQHRAALSIYENAGDVNSAARELTDLAALARKRNDLAAAQNLVGLARKLAGRSRVQSVLVGSSIEAARIALARGDTAVAAAALNDARTQKQMPRLLSASDRLAIAQVEVQLLAARGDRTGAIVEAERQLRGSLNIVSQTSPELRERDRQARDELMAIWVDLLGNMDAERATLRISEIVQLIESVRLHELSSWIDYAAVEQSSDEQKLVRELLLRRAHLESAQREGAKVSRLAKLQRQVEETTAALDLPSAKRSNASSTHYPVLDLANLRRQLRPDSALTLYAFGHSSMLRIWIDHDRTGLSLSDQASRVRTLIGEFTQHIQIQHVDEQSAKSAAAENLGRLLLEGLPLEHIQRWYVLTDGTTQDVAFPALIEPHSGTALVHSIAAISVPALTWLDDRPRTLTAPRIAVFADAVFDKRNPIAVAGPVYRGDSALPRLSATGVEAQAIARLASKERVQLWLGERANREELLSLAPNKYDILHIATHAAADARRLDATALLLSIDPANDETAPSAVGVRDILQHHLGSGLVVLSGCATSRGRDLSAIGSFGLTEAFLAAGAHDVISALWPVDDRATARLMESFYRHLLQGQEPAQALRAAQIELSSGPDALQVRDWSVFHTSAAGAQQHDRGQPAISW